MARPMHKQLETLRLLLQTKLSAREIASSVGLSKTTVGRYRDLLAYKRLSWDDVKGWSPAQIDTNFNKARRGNKVRDPLNVAALHAELAATGLTLQVWHEDYLRAMRPGTAYSYSSVHRKLHAYRKTLPTFMHMEHRPGEKVLVDFSGLQASYIDVATRKRVPVTVFVGVLGGSSYTFVDAIASQSVPDVMAAHARMFAFFGGVPHMVVPDNAKSFMTKPGPGGTPQRDYEDLARHYGLTIAATRVYHPKDKAKVEAGVKFVQQHVLRRLNTLTLYSLDEVRDRIVALLPQINARPMGNREPSRTDRFNSFERRTLRPLPALPYEYAEVKTGLKVDGGYHILVGHHRYSVPHALTGQRVDVRLTADCVEVFHEQKLVAKHARSGVIGGLTTMPAHQLPAHRAQADRNPEALKAWAITQGAMIGRFVHRLFEQDRPYMGLRPADQVKTFVSRYGAAAVERALKDFPSLDAANVTALKRKLSIQAKEGATPRQPTRSKNALGPGSFTPAKRRSDEHPDPFD
ncbi:Integrase core domain-containing protein [Luteibacter sp. UNCMF366Tsu5.1]|nr:Integrase core domain-containing protein [Luteibacter sp. UNCMF366Tsu5.1]